MKDSAKECYGLQLMVEPALQAGRGPSWQTAMGTRSDLRPGHRRGDRAMDPFR